MIKTSETGSTSRARMTKRGTSASPAGLGVTLLLALFVLGGCLGRDDSRSGASRKPEAALFASLDKALALRRLPLGRLSHPARREAKEVVPAQVVLGFGPSDETLEFARAAAEVEQSTEGASLTDKLQSVGSIRAIEGRLNEAILLLHGAVLDTPDRADLQSDLAAVYLSRFETNHRALDLISALRSAELARALDPEAPVVLFNRAEALSKLHLREQSRQAWQAFLEVEPSGEWAEFAQRELRLLEAPTSQDEWTRIVSALKEPGATSDEQLDQVIRRFPHAARRLVMEDLLPAWAAAYLEGQAEPASRRLDLARRLADALASQTGDHLLEEAVTKTEVATLDHPLRARHIAQGYRFLGRGFDLYYRGKRDEAVKWLRSARSALKSEQNPLWGMAALDLAIILHDGKPAEATSQFVALLRAFPEDRYPQVAGFSYWMLGTIESIVGENEKALAFYDSASRLLEPTAGDYSNGTLASMHAESLRLLGRTAAAWDFYLAGLSFAEQSGNPQKYHAALYTATETLFELNEPDVAEDLGEELVANATGVDTPLLTAEACLQLGRAKAELGRTEAAAHYLGLAESQARQIEGISLQRRTLGNVLAAEAEFLVDSHPDEAMRKLDEVVKSKLETGFLYQLAPVLFDRGRAEVALGQVDLAERDFLAAIEEYERIEETLHAPGNRRTGFELASSVFDAMIAFQVDIRKDPLRALDFAERRRTWQLYGRKPSPIVTPEPQARVEEVRRVVRAQPVGGNGRDSTILEYETLPDRLLVWKMDESGLTLTQRRVGRGDIERQIARFENAVERRATPNELLPLSEDLFKLLIEVGGQPPPAGSRLVFVPDRVLAKLPFAALVEPRAHTYVIQKWLPVIALARPSLYEVKSGSSPGVDGTKVSLLAVSAPSVADPEYPDLEPLREAEHEAKMVSSLFPRSLVLSGREATSAAFLDQVSRHSIVYLAVHSWYESGDPSESGLLFSNGEGGLTLVSQDRIASLDLTAAQVVVLATCGRSESNAPGRESASMRSAAAFVQAGADIVVASLWPIEDEANGTMMLDFASRLRAGEDVAVSLRAAQLGLLKRNGGNAPIGEWAGFEVFRDFGASREMRTSL